MPTTFGLPKKREEVVNLLEKAFLDQNLEETDYEQRLTQALQAKTIEELQEINADFPSQSVKNSVPKNFPKAYDTKQSILLQAILSKQTSELPENISQPLQLLAVMSKQHLNLQKA